MSDKGTDAKLVAAARHITKIEEVTLLCDRLEQYHDEVTIVLGLLDGLANQWGDEAVFRRCRDRLRELVNGPV
jgi:hypothetical protein